MAIRPCITFPQAPLRSRTVGSPESGSDLGYPRMAFPLRAKLKCWSISTPHRIGLHTHLDLSPSYGLTVVSGSASGLRQLQTRQVPRAPLHRGRRYPPGQGVAHPVGKRYPAVIAPTGSCASPISSPRLGFTLAHRVFAGCDQPLLQIGPSRRYLCESVPTCLDPYPGGPQGASARFFPWGIGLPRSHSGSALHKKPGQPLPSRGSSRGCSHFIMFRPASLLAAQVAPTARSFRTGAAAASTSEHPTVRYLPVVRIC